MESEKVKVIKEYLRCMRGEKACWDCGLNEIAENQDTCCINLVADMALDIINELESENDDCYERATILRRENEQLKTLVDSLENQITKLKDLIAELEKENAKNANCLKQFAERLKEKMTVHYPSVIESIDETLKEYYQKNG